MKIDSVKQHIDQSAAKVYGLIADCSNLAKISSDRMTVASVSETACKIEVQGMPTISFERIEAVPNTKVTYRTDYQNATITFFIEEIAENACEIYLSFEGDMPFFAASLLKGPLKNAADTIVGKLRTVCEAI